MKTKEERMYMRIRNICGLLGVILPWLALFSAGLTEHPSKEWWYSISATYYQSPALVGVLAPAALVLICYIGYNKMDNWITTLSGVFGLGIVLFPVQVVWIEPDIPVGFFQLPCYMSNYFHCVCAALFFLFIAFNSIYLFTKTGGNMTPKKILRNRVYKTCGWGMVALMVVFGITCAIPSAPGYITMIVEILLLHLFGISWLVKGEAIPFLNDDEE